MPANNYSGALFNATSGLSAEITATLSQSGCGVTGYLLISSLDLVGSGPLEGELNGNEIHFIVSGETNDAGVDLVFKGSVEDYELAGSYTAPATGETGIWVLFPE